jgi:hypothetical protein
MNVLRVPCRLKGYADQPTAASVEVVLLDPTHRLKRAGRHLAVCWGAGILSVLIPIAHLFLVPGFVVAGVVLVVLDIKTDEIVRHAHGTCPDCGAEQDLDLGRRWRDGVELSCRSCSRMLRLQPEHP